jgi:dihydrofolate reductase
MSDGTSAPLFDVIVAADATNGGGIGFRGRIPWHVKEDMQHFRYITMDAPPGKRNAVIMGAKTYVSFRVPNDALPGRFKVVLSRTFSYYETINVHWDKRVFVTSFEEAVDCARKKEDIHKIFVIGGTNIYKEALQHPGCGVVYFTDIQRPNNSCEPY